MKSNMKNISLKKGEEDMDNIQIENLIEDRFRNISLETKIISYIVQKDQKVSFLVNEFVFTIKAYQLFLKIIRDTKMEYPKKLFWEVVKKEIEIDDYKIFKYPINSILRAPDGVINLPTPSKQYIHFKIYYW